MRQSSGARWLLDTILYIHDYCNHVFALAHPHHLLPCALVPPSTSFERTPGRTTLQARGTLLCTSGVRHRNQLQVLKAVASQLWCEPAAQAFFLLAGDGERAAAAAAASASALASARPVLTHSCTPPP